jgi:hypothetical protein
MIRKLLACGSRVRNLDANMELVWTDTTAVPNDANHRRALDTNLHFALEI